MAEYTMELKDVIANGHNIFDFAYPFYDENKRPDFEKAFIRHFYFREIGSPTVDRFKLYLEDKMNTVFPYYNELFNAANIEYSVLDNYNLTEEFTTTRENQGKTSGIASSVGQAMDKQETKSHQNRVTDSNGLTDSKTETNDQELSKTIAHTDGKSVVTTDNKTTDKGENEKDSHSVNKFLDTPQGLTDLSESKYLTNLTDIAANERNATSSEQVLNGSQDTVSEGTSDTDVDRNLHQLSATEQQHVDSEVTKDDTDSSFEGEQKTTQDSNTRTYHNNTQTEVHKLVRKGNIGVDTDSDMIEKHIRLQKTLRQIERLFFDECEDLFMLVY